MNWTHDDQAETTGRLRRPRRSLVAWVALLVLVPVGVAYAHGAGVGDQQVREDLRRAARATAAFEDPEAAKDAGYGPFPEGHPLHECIDMQNGAMGIHWVNSSLLDAKLDVEKPEVLVYAPAPNGDLRLVAHEYVVFAEVWTGAHDDAGTDHPDTVPTLFGRQLTFHSVAQGNNPYQIPSFWEIHAWVHRPNPDGPFAAFNPTVRCR